LQPEPPAQARTRILPCGHHGVIGMILWSWIEDQWRR